MDIPNWVRKDGERLANSIYEKLVEKGELSNDEILHIYDACGFSSIFRKTEGVAWGILNAKTDVERVRDGKDRLSLKYNG
jgi:hypothetical protein